jgi:predicted aldo/keto reductase-like oxidoreductase
MQKRQLGKTRQELTVIGFGGTAVMGEDARESERRVAQAIERGINYFDVAPQYGNAEEMLGPALMPYRDSVFLACKTLERSAKGSEFELHRSLERLKTDHFDLYQFHCIETIEDVEKITAKGGALETFVKAREKGLIRHIGLSVHSEAPGIELMNRFDFDTVMFPINFGCWLKGNFGPALMKVAAEKGLGIMALKALAKRKRTEDEKDKWNKCWYVPVDNYDDANLALRFTLSQPITAAVCPGHTELLNFACDAAENLSPLSDDELKILVQKTQNLTPIFSNENP